MVNENIKYWFKGLRCSNLVLREILKQKHTLDLLNSCLLQRSRVDEFSQGADDNYSNPAEVILPTRQDAGDLRNLESGVLGSQVL